MIKKGIVELHELLDNGSVTCSDLVNESGKTTLTTITTNLKALPVYAQPNLKVSYNSSPRTSFRT